MRSFSAPSSPRVREVLRTQPRVSRRGRRRFILFSSTASVLDEPSAALFSKAPSRPLLWFRSGFTARSSGCLTDLIGGRYVVPTRQSARLRRKAQTSSINGVHHLRPGVVEIGNLRFLATDGARVEKRRYRLFVGGAKKLITRKNVKGEIYKFHL